MSIQTLWLNRAVCSRAALTEITRASLLRVTGTRRMPSVAEVLASIGLGVADVPTLSSHAATTVDDPVVQDLLLATLISDQALRTRALADARRTRDRVCSLVARELAGDRRLTVVDIGWGGSVAALLADLCADGGLDIDVHGLYLATNEAAAERILGGAVLEGFVGDLNLPEPLLELVRPLAGDHRAGLHVRARSAGGPRRDARADARGATDSADAAGTDPRRRAGRTGVPATLAPLP